MSWARATAKARKAVLLLFPLVALLAGGAPSVLGQTVADDFDPNANDEIHVVVIQPDGKVILGGEFSTLAPNGGATVTRNRIARLNTDGTLDAAFNPNANNDIDSIAIQADGKILVGGKFTSIGGQTRHFIARLDATTGLPDSFSANTNSNVIALAVQPDGKILAGGNFTGIAGQTRFHLARLDPTTGQPDSLDVNADDDVNSIVLQGDGKILVGGWFNRMGGQTRHHMARLDPITGLADSFNPDTNGPVLAIGVLGDGKILAGGGFLTVGEQMRSCIARLDATTGMADSFNPNADDWVRSIALQADGKILAGGSFRNIGGQPHAYIARFNSTTGLADLFVPYPYEAVYSIAVQTDGKILAGGAFSSIGGELRHFIGRLVFVSGPPPAAQPLNLSTRMKVETGENVGIAGFIITGTAPKHVVLRVIGPSIGPFPPSPDALRDPVLELHGPGAFVTITNDNWRDDPAQEAAIRAAGLELQSDLESAIDTTLNPGSYTGVVSGKNDGSGIAVIEVYDLSRAAPAKLANISTRAFVGTGNNIVIAGFILGGNSGNDRIIVRGIGPSLVASGVSNVLANPKLELRDQNGVPLVFINDWQDDPTQAAEISAAGLEPGSNLESAIAATLPPGAYTTLLYGVNNGTGVGLIEVYDLGAP